MSKKLTWKEWQAKARKEYVKNVFTAKDMLKEWGFPSDVDPETVQILFDKGNPRTKLRSTRRRNKANSEKSRRESLRSISTREFAEWGRRNGFSQAQIDAAVKWERQTKSKQTKAVRDSDGSLQADHVTPQPSRKPADLKGRYNRVLPGDAAANRQVKPTAINNDKSDRWPTTQERRAAGAPLTRSSAIRQAFVGSGAYEVTGGVIRRAGRSAIPAAAGGAVLTGMELAQRIETARQNPTALNLLQATLSGGEMLADGVAIAGWTSGAGAPVGAVADTVSAGFGILNGGIDATRQISGAN